MPFAFRVPKRVIPRFLKEFLFGTEDEALPSEEIPPIPDTDDSFFHRPYCDRQLVLFVDKDVIVANHNAEHQRGAKGHTGRDSRDISIYLNTPIDGLVSVLVDLINSYQKARNQGINVTFVEKRAAKLFKLPPGHPRSGVLYAGHPADDKVYMPVADFHRLAFDHKFAEAISLLMHLGATTIEVEHVTGWSSEFMGKIGVAVPGSHKVDASVNRNSVSGSTLLFKATLSGTLKPSEPSGLVWYPHEPTWQRIAEGRIRFGLKQFELDLHYKDDYGINASLKGKVSQAGLDVGGEFEEHKATTWRIKGEFASS